VVVVAAAVVAIIAGGGDDAVAGRAAPAVHGSAPPSQPATRPPSVPGNAALVAPLVPQPDWTTTLSNPASGLTYQIPPNWSTDPQNGTIASVALAQGAQRTAYTCGKPVERLLRGILGSGSAPKADPASLAAAVAQAAATQYYATDSAPPSVTLLPAQPVARTTKAGTTLRGVLVRGIATQHADPCLASRGEVVVFVLQFADHDGVLLVNADVAGGPASPAPATERELLTIVGTARPTS
jgi:hypothetical protein